MKHSNEIPKGLTVKDYEGEGYDRTFTYSSWRVAFLNFAERFDHITYLERHLLTDEVFVLLNGTAELLIGETGAPVSMENGKLYVVAKGAWHNIRVSPDAKVLVIENSDTGKENSEYMDFFTKK